MSSSLSKLSIAVAAFALLIHIEGSMPALALDPASDPASTLKAAQTAVALRDGAFTGQVADAYYGDLQVRAIISAGRIVKVEVLQYPNDRGTSRRINDRALPVLQSEVIRAQSTKVNAVSGATLTSRAYLRSLSSALSQAGA